MRKGQGALEYLMTYGWALLIIVVVAAALYALGVLNPATYAQSRCNGLQYFTWEQQQLSQDSGYTAQVRNGNQEINVTGIKFGTMASSVTPTTVTVNGVSKLGQFIASGTVVVISTTTDATASSSGETYSNQQLEITYDIRNGLSGNKDIATCTGKVQ